MGLGEHTIRYWDEMNTTFVRKYQEYCRSNDSHNDIFKMQQQEDETLEDYVERFVYNLQKSRLNALNPNAIRAFFLKGILEDYTNMLNLMAAGDISQKPFEEIVELCQKYSCSKSKHGKGVRAIKSAGGGVTRTELGSLLDNFKTYILGTLSSQIDSMNIKKKFEDEALTIFCSRCKKRHPLKNYLLNDVSLCGLRVENHETNNCPSLPELQAIYKEASKPTRQAMQGAKKKPWQARPQGMFADPYLQFNPYAQWNQWGPINNTPFQNQPFPNQP